MKRTSESANLPQLFDDFCDFYKDRDYKFEADVEKRIRKPLTALKKIGVAIIIALLISCNAPDVKPWPGGEIPFVIVNLSSEETAIVLESMLAWEIASGGKIKFVLSENIGDGIVYIGKVDNAPDWFGGMASRGFSLKHICKVVLSVIDKKVALHELGHTIGLADDYINKESIMYFEYYSSLNDGYISPFDVAKVDDLY